MKKLLMVLAIGICMFGLIGMAQGVTLTETVNYSYATPSSITYNVTNDTADSIYGILIGASTWGTGLGGPIDPNNFYNPTPTIPSDWALYNLTILDTQSTEGIIAYYDTYDVNWNIIKITLFENLPSDFESYNLAYLIYAATSVSPIAPNGGKGTFTVGYAQIASPFVYTTDYVNLEGLNLYAGSGESSSPVPEPASMLLLGTGLLGLIGFRRKFRK